MLQAFSLQQKRRHNICYTAYASADLRRTPRACVRCTTAAKLPIRHSSALRATARGVAQPGRAPGSGPGGRRFKSSLPDQSLLQHLWLRGPSLRFGISAAGSDARTTPQVQILSPRPIFTPTPLAERSLAALRDFGCGLGRPHDASSSNPLSPTNLYSNTFG